MSPLRQFLIDRLRIAAWRAGYGTRKHYACKSAMYALAYNATAARARAIYLECLK